ncbi:glycosyltransferase family 4 protein [Durotheca rogersii]|uniref:glycosyltransferase family 4 protein n=1 Tax=Durotheca rogersii TaxID=419775 RepID=UPI0022200354|nr:glycosyltransferase family 4 protein [Durotheca rogersii]KAI5864309.1 glycosyltransferase family 4 protein [Durotheca rogersii]
MAEKTTREATSKTIFFFHPDLGIGGAERLVIDAAVGLQNRGHKVVLFTSHCDRKHCFDEARDGTLDVRVGGNTIIPPSILSRFSILCSILRQLHLILQVHLSPELRALQPDAYFVDQLSAGLPLLQLLRPRGRVLFYCHFPDLLLVQGRGRWWKRAYRLPFDWLEQWSMGFADAVAVNSEFTKRVVRRTWPGLARRKDLQVVYPCVGAAAAADKAQGDGVEGPGDSEPLWGGKKFLLSINRFERKKDVGLAIRAFAGLGADARRGVRLVLAGGYDPRVAENVAYHRELARLAEALGLRAMTAQTHPTALEVPDDVEVLFLLSVPHRLKAALLASARLLVYTPAGEHFGIVPVEAMLAGLPVLAAADEGGPTETVVDGLTGWLRPAADPPAWSAVMHHVLHTADPAELAALSRAGAARARDRFGAHQMARRLDDVLDGMLRAPARTWSWTPTAAAGAAALAVLAAVAAVVSRALLLLAYSPRP